MASLITTFELKLGKKTKSSRTVNEFSEKSFMSEDSCKIEENRPLLKDLA